MTIPSLQDILRKVYDDPGLTLQEAHSDEMRFTTSIEGGLLSTSVPLFTLTKEMHRAGFRTHSLRGVLVRGYGVVLQSLSDFTKDPSPGSSLATVGSGPHNPTSTIYGMVLDRSFVGQSAVVTSPPISSEVQTALEQIGSFEFDEDGRVRRQPDPDTYEEALRVLKRVLLPR